LEEVKVKRWALLIGFGLALFPVHNVYLTNLTIKDGEVGFFIPAFGAAVWLIGTLLFITWNWDTVKQNGLGDKRVFIPLLVIVFAMGLSGITADTIGGKFAPLLMGLSLFSLYLVARVLGKDMFLPLAVGAGIASVGVIIHGVVYSGEVTGGFVFERNYDIVVGYVLLGMALFIHRYQWVLACLALVAMFMTGSPEAIFVIGVMAIAVMARRDWGKRLVLVVAPLVIIGILFFSLGYGQQLYSYTFSVAELEPTMEISGEGISAVGYRFEVIKEAMTSLKPLGEGYILTDFSRVRNVHNVPLVLVQQLGYPGILAGGAWLFVSFYCLIKTRYKYVWVLVLALSVFDHFVWTQLAPWWWAIIGVSTASKIKSDLIFRNNLENTYL